MFTMFSILVNTDMVDMSMILVAMETILAGHYVVPYLLKYDSIKWAGAVLIQGVQHCSNLG